MKLCCAQVLLLLLPLGAPWAWSSRGQSSAGGVGLSRSVLLERSTCVLGASEEGGEESRERQVLASVETYAKRLEQACFAADPFWALVERSIPGLASDPDLERFRGFCHNLKNEPPGEIEIDRSSGREVLRQFTYPELPSPACFHHPSDFDWVAGTLSMPDFVAKAKEELGAVLAMTPLFDDDRPPSEDESDGTSWTQGGWYGSQYLPLRARQVEFQRTIQAMVSGEVPYSHRFVGIARQKAQSIGRTHSDHRNYVLSTLTGVDVPEGCGICVGGETRDLREGETLILDNTFPHHIFNHGERDRFVLIAEVWHPDLGPKERDAMRSLFALKDLYTLVHLQAAPWGFTDDVLESAISDGSILKMGFWRDLDYSVKSL